MIKLQEFLNQFNRDFIMEIDSEDKDDKTVLDLAKDIHPFVMHYETFLKEEIILAKFLNNIENFEESKKVAQGVYEQEHFKEIPQINAPFSVCSLEFAEENYFTFFGQKIRCIIYEKRFVPNTNPHHIENFIPQIGPQKILGFYQERIIASIFDKDKNSWWVTESFFVRPRTIYSSQNTFALGLYAIVKHYLEKIPTSNIYIEYTDKKLKVKTKHGNEYTRINPVIHITNKTIHSKIGPYGGPMEYTHRFEVRGHWRRISPTSIGKNSNNQWVVQGKTWVRDSVRGPDYLPLIKKQRIVHGGTNGEVSGDSAIFYSQESKIQGNTTHA